MPLIAAVQEVASVDIAAIAKVAGVPIATVAAIAMGGRWTPAEITTALWLDASDAGTITESGGAVSQWDDKSGLGNNATQATGSKQPTTGTRTINGKNVLDFVYANQTQMAFPAIDLLGKTVFFVLEREVGPTAGQAMVLGHTGVNVQLRISTSSGILMYASSAPYYTSQSTGSIALDTPAIGGALFDTTLDWSIDGTFETGGGNDGSGNTTYNNIGWANDSGGTFFDGKWAELIIADSILSTEDRQKVEGYLAWKWGLEGSLPGGHPYKSAPPMV